MKITINKTLNLPGNDVYIAELIGKDIVINNNYEGITILDSDLNYKQIIDLPNNQEVSINNIFSSTQWLIIDRYEEKTITILNRKDTSFINHLYSNFHLTKLYHEINNKFILYGWDGQFILLDCLEYFLKIIDPLWVKKYSPHFFSLCTLFTHHRAISLDQSHSKIFFEKEKLLWIADANNVKKLGSCLDIPIEIRILGNIPLILTERKLYTFINQQPYLLQETPLSRLYNNITMINNYTFITVSYDITGDYYSQIDLCSIS